MTAFVPSRKFLVAAFLLAMTVANLSLPLRLLPELRHGYQDFTIFYMSGLLLRNGQASDLYNQTIQSQTQATFAHVPFRPAPLPYNHPPFEALLFVPFTLLGYWPAYLLWNAFNLILLAVSVVLLRRQFPQLAAVPPLLLGLGATAFFPVAIGILQGQDVFLLLLLFVLAIICLDRGNDAAGGALLAAGLFRPHLIVPVALLLAVRRWRVLAGFAPVALALAGISVAITGWRGPLDYLHFVLHVEKTVCPGCYGPQTIPNLRGLIQELPGLSASSPWTTALILVLSMAVFLAAMRRIRNGRDTIGFSSSLAAVTALLVSYHLLTHELILLLPLVLFLLSETVGVEGKRIDVRMVLVVLLCLTPLYVFLMWKAGCFFLFSLVLLWLYLRLVLTPASAEAPA